MANPFLQNMNLALAQHQAGNNLVLKAARQNNHVQNQQTIQDLEEAIELGRINNLLLGQAYIEASNELIARKAERVLYLADVAADLAAAAHQLAHPPGGGGAAPPGALEARIADLEKELAGTRRQLQDIYSHKQSSILLARIGEKPLSALTEDEIALLKSVGNKPSQNRA